MSSHALAADLDVSDTFGPLFWSTGDVICKSSDADATLFMVMVGDVDLEEPGAGPATYGTGHWFGQPRQMGAAADGQYVAARRPSSCLYHAPLLTTSLSGSHLFVYNRQLVAQVVALGAGQGMLPSQLLLVSLPVVQKHAEGNAVFKKAFKQVAPGLFADKPTHGAGRNVFKERALQIKKEKGMEKLVEKLTTGQALQKNARHCWDCLHEPGLTELLVYLSFIFIFTVYVLQVKTTEMYFFNEGVKAVFRNNGFGDTFEDKFKDINNWQMMWEYLEGPMVFGLFQDFGTNLAEYHEVHAAMETSMDLKTLNVTESLSDVLRKEKGAFYQAPASGVIQRYTSLVGPVRVRVKRKKQLEECDTAWALKPVVSKDIACYGSAEETQPYGLPPRLDAYTFSDSDETETGSYRATVGTYNGGGYYVDLPSNYSEAAIELKMLKETGFVDANAEVLFVDFVLFNSYLTKFCVVRLTFEMLPVGGLLPRSDFTVVQVRLSFFLSCVLSLSLSLPLTKTSSASSTAAVLENL